MLMEQKISQLTGKKYINLFICLFNGQKERFTEWITKFNDKCITCDVSHYQKLDIMTSDGQNVFKIHCLPDRIQNEVTKVREDQLTWAEVHRKMSVQ